MLYNPKFCCECGEKVERPDRKFWTSRRFCELCETDFLFTEWLGKIGVGAGLLFGMIYLGSAFLPAPAVNHQDKSAAELPARRLAESQAPNGLAGNLNRESQPQRETENAATALPPVSRDSKPSPALNKQIAAKQTTSAGAVYFCGAETKKGTPCTRRVKGGGRCWQHAGREAMLSERELLASQ